MSRRDIESVSVLAWVALLVSATGTSQAEEAGGTAKERTSESKTVVIQLPEGTPAEPVDTSPKISGRFTADALAAFLEAKPDSLPLPMALEPERQAALAALARVDMGAVVEDVRPHLEKTFAGRFDASRDVLVAPVPATQQVTVDLADIGLDPYTGPKEEVLGFVIHGITEAEYTTTAFRVLETVRQLVDTGNPMFIRSHPDHYRVIAESRADAIRETAKKAAAEAREKAAIRERIGKALGIFDPQTGEFSGEGNWLKETRRFSYVVNAETGQFIERLQPVVADINHAMEVAGFAPPNPLDKPGIYFDPDLGDVEVVLPRPMLQTFLQETDALEQRMAEQSIISIEAVRLTDRDIVDGAVAARLNAQIQAVHDTQRFRAESALRELGINSLLAVANQQLQVRTLNAVAAGAFPAGVAPVQIAPPTLPPIRTTTDTTLINSNFSVGADDIFFDGRQQSYGFSYIGPDGIEHRLSLDVVDSLREFWTRIERNLIVHKIKKDPTQAKTKFQVPVGPESKTYEGLAALISQEDQQLIVSSGNAVEKIEATAGTWLVIQDFSISPIPGSSTTMTEEELSGIEDKVLLTMWLRDPETPVEFKRQLLEVPTRQALHAMLHERLSTVRSEPISPGRAARNYGEVFADRYALEAEEAATEKKETNSVIGLTFYSSEGNIVQTQGTTQLGSANDLTSFTTELRPNEVTPISSSFTKNVDSARGTSPLTGVRKGESNNEAKSMTHLIVRARFPTTERERKDRDEGRYLGYFELPFSREPLSEVNLPFLSSSEHPLERLAQIRVGVLFDALRADRIRKPFELLDPNILAGKVPPDVWVSATTRLLCCQKIITDSPGSDPSLGVEYKKRFIAEVRSLLEYDPDFFAAPNTALRSMAQWNNADRIVLALNNAPDRFALERLIGILDELGETLVPDSYADQFLAYAPDRFLAGHRLQYLTEGQLTLLRRDVANHYLRFREAYGDAFLEAVSRLLGLGTYRATRNSELLRQPFRSYRDLVIFDRGGRATSNTADFEYAHGRFIYLKQGGYKGKLFEASYETLEQMSDAERWYAIRGAEIVGEVP
jgi:hypothetical protein